MLPGWFGAGSAFETWAGADPSHLDSLLRSIKQIDAIYDAYRIVPGKGG